MVGGHAEVLHEAVDSLAAAGGCWRSLDKEPGADGESCQPALDTEEEEGGQYPHCLRPGQEVVTEGHLLINFLLSIPLLLIEKL